jgi:5-methylcytosine-specific restriction endonuclease McrA
MASKRRWINPQLQERVRNRYINCFYCGAAPESRPRDDWPPPCRLEIDHLVALELGGTDDESNLVMACDSCNRSKGAKTVPAFAHWLQTVTWPRWDRAFREAYGA